MDLAKGYPSGPRATLGGLIWLPRLIDKARARIAGTLGEYTYNCPMDEHFFRFTGIGADAFLEAVRKAPDDAAVLAWVKANRTAISADGIAGFNAMLVGLGPDAPDPKTGLKTWCDFIDRDEGRI
jgi:hypothetical protein